MTPSGYCAMDINLWGRFHKLKELRHALTEVFGSELVSSYRVVVGGMYGSPTWEEDRKIIGPQIVQTRACDEREFREVPEMNTEIIQAAFDEALTLVQRTDVTAVVLCADMEKCLASDFLTKRNDLIKNVLKPTICPGIDGDTGKMYDCEIAKIEEMNSLIGSSKADLFVIDETMPYAMLQIWNSIFHVDAYRSSWIQEDNVFMAWSSNPQAEPWRINFLDRYRKQHQHDPVVRAEFAMQAGHNIIEFGLVSAGDELAFYSLEAMEINLRKNLGDKGVDVELREIHGGLYPIIDEWDPKAFRQSDYENLDGVEQFNNQMFLGHQVVFQLEPKGDGGTSASQVGLMTVLEKSLAHIDFEATRHHVNHVGDGAMMVYLSKMGTVVLIWDGRVHTDINFFLHGNPGDKLQLFMGAFLHFSDRKLTVSLRDDMPRGTNRIINFDTDE